MTSNFENFCKSVSYTPIYSMSYENVVARSFLKDNADFQALYGKFDDLKNRDKDPIKLIPKPAFRIAKGSEGYVYFGLYVQGPSRKIVAVKRIQSDDEELKKNVNHQITALLKLKHENIIRYYCYDYDNDFEKIAIELCLGSLVTLLSNGTTVFGSPYPKNDLDGNWSRKKEMLLEIANGMDYMHRQGVVHRDLKPSNILVKYDPQLNKFIPVISDFGLSREVDPYRKYVTVSQQRVGSHGWMPPETLNGSKRAGCSGDVFAFGCLAQFIMTFQRSFEWTSVKAEHPFGVDHHRNGNIAKSLRVSFISEKNVHADTLFADLLIDVCVVTAAEKRISAPQILNHPLFWSNERKMTFLEDCNISLITPPFMDGALKAQVEQYWKQFSVPPKKKKGSKKKQEPLGLLPEKLYGFKLASDSNLSDIIRLIRNRKQHPEVHRTDLYCPERLGSGTSKDFYRYCFNGKFALVFPMAYICYGLFDSVDFWFYGKNDESRETLIESAKSTFSKIFNVAGPDISRNSLCSARRSDLFQNSKYFRSLVQSDPDLVAPRFRDRIFLYQGKYQGSIAISGEVYSPR
eukprot:sb/3463418/